MKRILLAAAICLVAVLQVVAAQEKAGEDTGKSWFDPTHCAICKHMQGHDEFTKAMHWEIHMLDDGVLSVAVFPKRFKKVMEETHKDIEKTVAKLEAGEALPLCGYCQSYGALLHEGMQVKEFDSAAGMISTMTSDDPELVKKIQTHAERAVKEYKRMKKEMVGAGKK